MASLTFAHQMERLTKIDKHAHKLVLVPEIFAKLALFMFGIGVVCFSAIVFF